MSDNPTSLSTPARPVLLTAVSIGGGMVAGLLLTYILLNNQIARRIVNIVDQQQPFLKLFVALLFLLTFAAIGGALGGWLGGRAIKRYSRAAEEDTSYTWRGALSFFLAHFVIVLPALAYALIASFFHPDIDVSWSRLPQLFAALGVLYGLIGGSLFGLLTVGVRRFLWVVLAAVAGFGLGGLLLGLFIRLAADQASSVARLLFSLLGMFFFGALGGGAMGLVYERIDAPHGLLPGSRLWRVARNLAIAAIIFTLFVFFYNAITLLYKETASLEPLLVLPTEGTAWEVNDGAPSDIGLVAEAVEPVACAAGVVSVPIDGAAVLQANWPPCTADPLAARAADGRVHIVYYTDRVTRNSGASSQGHFIVESILDTGAWTQPAIIQETAAPVAPRLSSGAAEELILEWDDGSGPQFATMTPYACEGVPPGRISQAIYEAVRDEQFRPADDPVTWCQNHFDRLHFTPNPSTPTSELPPRDQGAFDSVADVVRRAQYEVLFVTMQWDAPTESVSPGDTLAMAIGDLYQNLREHPEQYPRGLTVRILLGNLPETTLFSLANQVMYVLSDLGAAGVYSFSQPEIGWKLELGNFDGSWPHAHSKFVVVDGKTAVAAGFNYSYLHLDENHPSGLGLGMTDMGIQITGPIAQSVLAAYDDLWSGSHQIICGRTDAPFAVLYFFLCTIIEAQATHTPEVLRFHPQDPSAYSSFALHHTPKHLESDAALVAAMQAAEETIDLFEVNFSLETVCVVGILLDAFCAEEAAVPIYMTALRDAIIENDIQVRAMVEASAMNGFENRLAIRWLLGELEEAGKLDNVDLRFSAHKMHNKGVLVDRELLSVGSQNFHWSAWGDPSLTEYNMATDDPRAVDEFLTEYEYWWDVAVPVAEDNLLEELRERRGE